MNHDVGDYLGSNYDAQPLALADNHTENNKDEEASTTIVSRLRSLFSQIPECNEIDPSKPSLFDQSSANRPSQLSDQATFDKHHQAEYPSPNFLDMAGTTNPTHRFSDVKRILTNFTMSTRQLPAATACPTHSRFESDGSSVLSGIVGFGESVVSQTPSASSVLTMANTPPLTPDTLSPLSSEELARFQCQYQDSQHQQYQNSRQPNIRTDEEEQDTQDIRHPSAQLRDIKEGKKPQRPIVRTQILTTKLTREPIHMLHVIVLRSAHCRHNGRLASFAHAARGAA
jgi:hypothetical protein